MGKDWDYSDLSHKAKENGGPEKFIEKIEQNAREDERELANKDWVTVLTPVALVAIPFIVEGIPNVYKKCKSKIERLVSKKTVSDEEAAEAKKQLIQYINDHDDCTEEQDQ